MLPKRVYKVSGISFLSIGIILLLNSIVSITGNAIIEDIQPKISSFWALWFIAVGVSLLVESRNQSPSGLEIFISNKALERSERDKYVKSNMKRYLQEIRMIAANPMHRSQEMLGEFHVSPRGHKNIRVAWHYDHNSSRLYVDDLLYHERGDEYVDKWNVKVANGKIKKNDYIESGFASLA